MADLNILSDLRKAKEEEYFHKKEQELIAKMRHRALKEQESQLLSEFFYVEDAEILNNLQELGYSRDTIFLLFLVPVIQVAWIDGTVTEKEREAIIEIARQRGMESDSPSESMLHDWLNNRPSEEFFDRTLSLIRNILETRPKVVRNIRGQTLAHYCNAVASASGGFLGFGKISAAQKELINRIAKNLEVNHPSATVRVLKRIGALSETD